MSLVKRAWLSVSRRIGKSVVLLLIMTVIFTALAAEASVRGSMQALRESVSRGVPAGFVVHPGTGELSLTDAQTVSGVQGLSPPRRRPSRSSRCPPAGWSSPVMWHPRRASRE